MSQDDAILIKNLYMSKQYGARRLLSDLPDKGWKLGSIDSLLKRIRKTGTIVQQPGSGRPRLSFSSGGPCAQSGGQARKALISSWNFAWNCHSLFKYAQDNSLWSPAQMFQTTSCSAVVWSQSHLPSHSPINNVIVCNKSCWSWIISKNVVIGDSFAVNILVL